MKGTANLLGGRSWFPSLDHALVAAVLAPFADGSVRWEIALHLEFFAVCASTRSMISTCFVS
jgi:hypothetical protein